MMMSHFLASTIGAAVGVTAVLLCWLWQAQRRTAIPWRTVLAVLPLPMLALAASYGVYSFSLLFVPVWVAVVSAAAFELTYIGLSVLIGLDERQRRRAGLIAGGAVAVSILYNSLAGLFHRRPELLALPRTDAWGVWLDVLLSIAHGLPLALVAYFVADLLLHRGDAAHTAHLAALLAAEPPAPVVPPTDAPAALPAPDAAVVLASVASSAHTCKRCAAPVASPQAVAASARWGCAQCKKKGSVA